jgi:hypothetical protein
MPPYLLVATKEYEELYEMINARVPAIILVALGFGHLFTRTGL